MPELPEVETIKRSLNEAVIGQIIEKVDIRTPKLWRGDKTEIIGQRIDAIARRAKALVWRLGNGRFLLFHLKMTGQLLYVERSARADKLKVESQGPQVEAVVAGGGHPSHEYLKPPPHKHTHVIFTLNQGCLYFNDLRKFGWIKSLNENELKHELANIGPEIDWPEFTFAYFLSALKRRAKTKIKTALMDQTIVAGIGNIYSDETLFCAKILPTRQVKDLHEAELKKIYNCLPKIMSTAIKYGGTSLKDYRQLDGSTGDFLKHANVYRRTGEPCRVCRHPLKRLIVNGRSAHFCPKCQK